MQVNMINTRHSIETNTFGFFGDKAMIRKTPINNSCSLTNKKGETMSSFGEIASKFSKLGDNKNIGTGLYLHTLMLFHSICHLRNDELTVENANKKHAELYGEFLNSASMSRNNQVLVKLGLIKLHESNADRRAKEIMFTTVGHKFKNLFTDLPKRAKEAI
jgi:hypothetical protein